MYICRDFDRARTPAACIPNPILNFNPTFFSYVDITDSVQCTTFINFKRFKEPARGFKITFSSPRLTAYCSKYTSEWWTEKNPTLSLHPYSNGYGRPRNEGVRNRTAEAEVFFKKFELNSPNDGSTTANRIQVHRCLPALSHWNSSRTSSLLRHARSTARRIDLHKDEKHRFKVTNSKTNNTFCRTVLCILVVVYYLLGILFR